MEKGQLIRRDYSPQLLAYLGDAYYETLAREYVLGDGNCLVSEINEKIKALVTAVSQSRIAERLIPHLTEEELWYYKSGRNIHSAHRAKSSRVGEYRRATGVECLFGFLRLMGAEERAKELFGIAVAKQPDCGGNNNESTQ